MGVISLSLLASPAIADNTEIRKYREMLFESVGNITKMIGNNLKGDAGTASDLIPLAEALNAHAQLVVPAFKTNTATDNGDSKANPKIWDNFDDFTKKAENFKSEAQNFLEIAKKNEINQKNFKQLTASCGSCHKAYKD